MNMISEKNNISQKSKQTQSAKLNQPRFLFGRIDYKDSYNNPSISQKTVIISTHRF